MNKLRYFEMERILNWEKKRNKIKQLINKKKKKKGTKSPGQ